MKNRKTRIEPTAKAFVAAGESGPVSVPATTNSLMIACINSIQPVGNLLLAHPATKLQAVKVQCTEFGTLIRSRHGKRLNIRFSEVRFAPTIRFNS